MIGGIVGGMLALLICIGLFIVIGVVVRRRKQKRNGQVSEANSDPIPMQTLNQSQTTQQTQTPKKPTTNYESINEVQLAVLKQSNSTKPVQAVKPLKLTVYKSLDEIASQVIKAPKQAQNQYQALPNLKGKEFAQQNNVSYDSTHKLRDTLALLSFEVPFNELHFKTELGKGEFGQVSLVEFRGTFLASKQLKDNASEKSRNEFVDGMCVERVCVCCLYVFTSSIFSIAKQIEAKLMSKIPQHRNVIQLVAICVNPFCILTEFVDGGSLREYLNNATITIQIQDAMSFISVKRNLSNKK